MMRNSILKYMLIVSLGLNISFLGAAGYTHYKQIRYHARTPLVVTPGGQGPFGLGMPMRTPSGNMAPGWIFQELALKPDQLKLFQQKARAFHADLYSKREEVDRLRTALFSMVRAENPDQKAIEAIIARINRMQEEMQKTVVAHMLEFKSMLNKEQQKK